MATLQTIRNKMRKITARDESQLSDSECDEYINAYYQFGLPEDLQILKLEDIYTFTTQPNIDLYYFDWSNYLWVAQPVRVGGYPTAFFTQPEQFYAIRPRYTYVQQIATGDGTNGPYTGTISSTPFHRSYNTRNSNSSDPTLSTFPQTNPIGVQQEVLISAQVSDTYSLNCTDTPVILSGSGTTTRYDVTGTFVGDVAVQQSGSINYFDGSVEITFSDNVPSGQPIYASVYVYAASRPRYVLFFQNQILVSPVPDNAYIVEMKTYRKPTELIQNSSVPELQEIWELLAVGASMKVFEDNFDMDSKAQLQDTLELYQSRARARGLIQMTRTRVPTIYSMGTYGSPLQDGTPYFAGF